MRLSRERSTLRGGPQAMQLSGRQHARVDYRVAVECELPGDDHEPRRLLARSVDLSEGGMRLRAPCELAVGDRITCGLELDGHAAELPASVAWVEPLEAPEALEPDEPHQPHDATREDEAPQDDAPPARGFGVRFDALGDEACERLRGVVDRARAGYRRVEITLEGSRDPVVARARCTALGLELTAALAPLKRGAAVAFRFENDEQPRNGQVGEVVIDEQDARRTLVVHVLSDEADVVRSRKRTLYGRASDIGAESSEEPERVPPLAAARPNAPEAAPPSDAPEAVASEHPPAAPVGGLAWSMLLAGLVCGAALGWLGNDRFARNGAATRLDYGGHVVQPARDALTTLQPPTPAPPAQLQPLPVALTEEVTAEAHEGTAQDAQDAQASSVLLESTDATTRVRIPVSGEPQRVDSAQWRTPIAINLEIPGATSPLEAGHHALDDAMVRELNVTHGKRSLLVRAVLKRKPKSYSASLEDSFLVLLLEH